VIRKLAVAVLLSLTATLSFAASAQVPNPPVRALALEAFSERPEVADRAIGRLREMGQPAVDGLMAIDAEERERQPGDTRGAARRSEALDRVCGQRDCAWSGLYWYTDLEAAEREAKRTNRPILSLRLLGNLDEELSCANSRFFRTTLYANRDIARIMRTTFVLHWSSERPAPRVTIDYGDGRRVVRTITGNSLHYLLASDGTPLDAAPGLYAPAAFSAVLSEMRLLFGRYQTWPEAERAERLVNWHERRVPPTNQVVRAAQPGAISLDPIPAWAIAELAQTKAVVEQPLLDRVSYGILRRVRHASARSDEKRASVDLQGFDEQSLTLMKIKHFGGRKVSDEAFQPILARLQKSVADDTVRNENEIRPAIRRIFVEAHGTLTLETLNRKVYDGVFLTPQSDPWLGLVPADAFTGIAGEGIVTQGRTTVSAR
jgi:hypothetical protein